MKKIQRIFVFSGKGGFVAATVGKSAKICEIFLACDFPFNLAYVLCFCYKLMKKEPKKKNEKKIPKTLPPK